MFIMHLEINTSEDNLKSSFKYTQTQEEEEFRREFGEIESFDCLFYLLCDRLERADIVKFRVEGFGNEPWPVDLRTDFHTVIEQCCEFLEFIETPSLNTGEIYLYEQGVERQLIFNKLGDLVQVQCKPVKYRGSHKVVGEAQSWGQDIEEPLIKLSYLKEIICQLVQTFVLLVNELDPEIANNQYFQAWCNNKYIANCL